MMQKIYRGEEKRAWKENRRKLPAAIHLVRHSLAIMVLILLCGA